ncbi:flagellar motor protein MotS [Evansella cellulosilytica]|uniref:OmpA/MotB domain protein n=1 Tax=Evansella cellulosilytica (strain ATCC 21833 / DSM 2522 / FERM P-1141 / JCM 9156 / N-4) TaxID=649639 RepID=E6U167_EVAC2|nr:flagellar motor protein MotS [Evansella cellulosilytica]ADU31513.1 OmpA/MotB domain protein [Evansella cellulosilytica DSM 2522]
MIRRRRQGNTEKGAPKWMVTFSDLMTLILVFFVLLFSMSVVDGQKFQAVAESFQDRALFEFYPSLIPFDNPAEDRDTKDDPFDNEVDPFENFLDSKKEENNQQLDDLLVEVLDFLEANNLYESISASRDDRGVVLVLQEQVLFESARAELISDATAFLDKVGTLIESVPNPIMVEGHTDSRPIETFQFPSNWELSGARASSVIRYLVDNHDLDQSRFVSVGYGDTRPIAPNTTNENLQKNRRVVIVIAEPDAENAEIY